LNIELGLVDAKMWSTWHDFASVRAHNRRKLVKCVNFQLGVNMLYHGIVYSCKGLHFAYFQNVQL